jgi:hypothetical protein
MTPRVFTVMPVGAIVIALVYPEYAFHAADCATHYSSDDCADRPSNATTFIISMRGPAGDALRLRGERCRTSGEKCGDQKLDLHGVLLRSQW